MTSNLVCMILLVFGTTTSATRITLDHATLLMTSNQSKTSTGWCFPGRTCWEEWKVTVTDHEYISCQDGIVIYSCPKWRGWRCMPVGDDEYLVVGFEGLLPDNIDNETAKAVNNAIGNPDLANMVQAYLGPSQIESCCNACRGKSDSGYWQYHRLNITKTPSKAFTGIRECWPNKPTKEGYTYEAVSDSLCSPI